MSVFLLEFQSIAITILVVHQLASLHVVHELLDNGIPFDRKKFSPHITLVRKASFKGGDKIPVTDAPVGSMMVTRVSLMRSERGKNGMVYTEIG